MTDPRSDRAKRRRDLVIIVALLFALFGAYVWDQHRTQEANRAAIVDALYANCTADREFRVQYKVRGKAEDKLLDLFLTLAQMNVDNGGPGAQRSKDFIKEFAPLAARIQIIPIPECSDQKAHLEEELNG